MSGRSRYDPLDMALDVLAKSANQVVQSGPPNDARPAKAPVHTGPATKVSTNIRMSSQTLARLRQGSIELARAYTLGEIIDRLVEAHLDQVISTMEQEPQAARLPSGRRIQASGHSC